MHTVVVIQKLEEALPVKTPDLELIKAANAKDVGRHMTESWVDVEKDSSSGSQNKTTITWFGYVFTTLQSIEI